MLFVNKCHSIFSIWTYDPDMGTVDGLDHACKVRTLLVSATCPGNDRNGRFCFQ